MAAGGLPGPHAATPAGKPRARSLGIPFGGTPGRWNAITDVPGVQVGYTTLIEGDAVRTGVTAIQPRGPQGAADPVATGFFPWGFLDPFCTAVVQAVEEAVANALTANEDMVGRAGHRTPALPRDRVAALFRSPRGNS